MKELARNNFPGWCPLPHLFGLSKPRGPASRHFDKLSANGGHPNSGSCSRPNPKLRQDLAAVLPRLRDEAVHTLWREKQRAQAAGLAVEGSA